MAGAVITAKFFAVIVVWTLHSPMSWGIVETQTLERCERIVAMNHIKGQLLPLCKAVVDPSKWGKKRKEQIGETTPADLERLKSMHVSWVGPTEYNRVCSLKRKNQTWEEYEAEECRLEIY